MSKKPKCPHKKHKLRPIHRDAHTPRQDRPEPTASDRRGYWPGANFTAAEVQFLKAIDRLRRKTGRKFLSAVDHLRVAIQLGYRLPEQPTPTTTPSTASDAE